MYVRTDPGAIRVRSGGARRRAGEGKGPHGDVVGDARARRRPRALHPRARAAAPPPALARRHRLHHDAQAHEHPPARFRG